MIDHTGITVADFDRAKAFYDAAMAPLGASLLHTVPPDFTGGAKGGGSWPTRRGGAALGLLG